MHRLSLIAHKKPQGGGEGGNSTGETCGENQHITVNDCGNFRRPIRQERGELLPLPLAQTLKPRREDSAAAITSGRDAPDFSRFAAWVAAYPDRRRWRRSSAMKSAKAEVRSLRCRILDRRRNMTGSISPIYSTWNRRVNATKIRVRLVRESLINHGNFAKMWESSKAQSQPVWHRKS